MRLFEVILCLAVVGTVVPPETSFSQERPPIMPGDRVRVTAPDCSLRRRTGEFQAVVEDSVHFAIQGEDTQMSTHRRDPF